MSNVKCVEELQELFLVIELSTIKSDEKEFFKSRIGKVTFDSCQNKSKYLYNFWQ